MRPTVGWEVREQTESFFAFRQLDKFDGNIPSVLEFRMSGKKGRAEAIATPRYHKPESGTSSHYNTSEE